MGTAEVQPPKASNNNSIGVGADERAESVSIANACPLGLMPMNSSSPAYCTTACAFFASIKVSPLSILRQA